MCWRSKLFCIKFADSTPDRVWNYASTDIDLFIKTLNFCRSFFLILWGFSSISGLCIFPPTSENCCLSKKCLCVLVRDKDLITPSLGMMDICPAEPNEAIYLGYLFSFCSVKLSECFQNIIPISCSRWSIECRVGAKLYQILPLSRCGIKVFHYVHVT